jgi:2,4-didehydro-3-deoxy-L-rhamnonate hydrolase
MKLLRFGKPGHEKPGILLESGQRKDVSAFFSEWDHDFFNNDGLTILANFLAEEGDSLPEIPADERLGPPIARPGKVIAIGLNYADHAAESGMAPPSEPVVFFKATSSICGPYDEVIIPRNSQKTDWEVELAVVIGKDCRYLASPAEAAGVIAGYMICHDVSERDFQIHRGGQWVKGKSSDHFCPLGPWLVTADAVAKPQDLDMWLKVNGQQEQTGNTRTMIFAVDFIIHYLSQFMTLEAGDVITTGTPPGVGMGKKPQRYLKAGDVVELSVAGLGSQRQVCVQA